MYVSGQCLMSLTCIKVSDSVLDLLIN